MVNQNGYCVFCDDPDVQRRFEAWKKERECAALQAAAEGGVTGE